MELRVVLVGAQRKRDMVCELLKEPRFFDGGVDACRSFHAPVDDVEFEVLDLGSEMELELLELRAEQWEADLFVFVVDEGVAEQVARLAEGAVALLPCLFVLCFVDIPRVPGALYCVAEACYRSADLFRKARKILEHWAMIPAHAAMLTVMCMGKRAGSYWARLPWWIVRYIGELVLESWHRPVPRRKPEKPPAKCKIALIGDGGCGKTAFVLRYVTGQYLDLYDPTIEDSYRKQEMVDGQKVALDLLDTAGCEEYSAMRDQYMRDYEGFLLCFSVTSMLSFESCATFMDQLYRVKDSPKVAVVVVGMKIDLDDRQVSYEAAQSWAASRGHRYLEASAATAEGVRACFVEIVRELDRLRQPPKFAARCVMAMRQFARGSVWWGMPRDVAKIIARLVLVHFFNPYSLVPIPRLPRVAVVGAAGVGKTAVVRRVTGEEFDEMLVPTTGKWDFEKVRVVLQETVLYKLWLCDAPGSDALPPALRANVYVVVYAVDNRDSFDVAANLLTELAAQGRVALLCGTRVDRAEQRVVSEDEGRRLAERFGVAFFEVSALTGDGVEEALGAVIGLLQDFDRG